MLIEVFLEFLVGKIDVELFKSIHFEILKSKNVKHSDKGKLVLSSSDSHVDSLQDPAKQVGIDTHSSGITRVFSLHYEEYEGVSLLLTLGACTVRVTVVVLCVCVSVCYHASGYIPHFHVENKTPLGFL